MKHHRTATALKATFRFILATVRIAVAVIATVVRCLARFPNATVCAIVGSAVTFGLYHLPGYLMYLWYAGAAGTLALFIRGAWVDLTVISSENRIAAKTMDTISRATGKDRP